MNIQVINKDSGLYPEELLPLGDEAPETISLAGNTSLLEDRIRVAVLSENRRSAATLENARTHTQSLVNRAESIITTTASRNEIEVIKTAVDLSYPIIVVVSGKLDEYGKETGELLEGVVKCDGLLVSTTGEVNMITNQKSQQTAATLAEELYIVLASEGSRHLRRLIESAYAQGKHVDAAIYSDWESRNIVNYYIRQRNELDRRVSTAKRNKALILAAKKGLPQHIAEQMLNNAGDFELQQLYFSSYRSDELDIIADIIVSYSPDVIICDINNLDTRRRVMDLWIARPALAAFPYLYYPEFHYLTPHQLEMVTSGHRYEHKADINFYDVLLAAVNKSTDARYTLNYNEEYYGR